LIRLISFDIDGTLEMGDPPGIITMDMVRLMQTLGYLIGSCSDRTIRDQQRLWAQHNIRVNFTVLKHQLDDVKAQFQTEAYYHRRHRYGPFLCHQGRFPFCPGRCHELPAVGSGGFYLTPSPAGKQYGLQVWRVSSGRSCSRRLPSCAGRAGSLVLYRALA